MQQRNGEVWRELRKQAETKSGFDHLDKSFAGFDRVLTADEDFGRRHHSPLECWKWLIIAVIVGALTT